MASIENKAAPGQKPSHSQSIPESDVCGDRDGYIEWGVGDYVDGEGSIETGIGDYREGIWHILLGGVSLLRCPF